MRIAVVSDIHGNLTAFEAVLADLRLASPDLILHGGDIADGGPGGAAVVDQIRHLGWPGVFGNSDEMLFNPQSLTSFAARSKAPASVWDIVREIAAFSRNALGSDRLNWLAQLPISARAPGLALVHATPETAWDSPGFNACDPEMMATYYPLNAPLVVYGHIHLPFVRPTLANSGSVGLPYDGDPRASWLLIDDGAPEVRRTPYDIDAEVLRLRQTSVPFASWVESMMRTGRPQPPPRTA